jgi:uncharacterized protein YggE
MPRLASLILVLVSPVVFAADELPHTITVSGFGSVETPPDRATVVLSIVSRQPTVAAAQKEASEVTARVLALTEDMDVPENRVDTMSATVRPDYRWNPQREEQELRGYIAERHMRVELHDLDDVGELIERAVEEGVNQVAPPRLSSSRQRDAYRDALQRAAEDATQNAERIAESLGLSLGDAIRVESGTPYQPPMPMARVQAMAADMAAPETYSAGDMTVSATVNVVFETGN